MPPSSTPAPGSEVWLRERGLERGEGRPPALPPGSGAPLPATGAPGHAGPARPDPKGMVDQMLADLKAADRAAHAPHTYWSGVRVRLEKGFDPGWEILEQGPGAGKGLVSGKAAGDAVRQYLASAGRYGRAGNPYQDRAVAPGAKSTLQDEVRRLQSRLPEEIQEEQESARPENTLFHQELEALLRLVQSAEGKVVRVELVQGSGNRAFDRLILSRAQALAEESEERLGPPPEQGRETVWAFTTAFDRVPPLPIVGCSFDAHFAPERCFYPLKTFSRSRVELRSVR